MSAGRWLCDSDEWGFKLGRLDRAGPEAARTHVFDHELGALGSFRCVTLGEATRFDHISSRFDGQLDFLTYRGLSRRPIFRTAGLASGRTSRSEA